MTQLGTGMLPRIGNYPEQEPTRIILQDGSAEAVARFCTEALAVLQQLSSVAQALGGSAGALAAAAGEVANNQRTIQQTTREILNSQVAITRMLNDCSQMMASMDMTPTVNVEAPSPVIPAAEVTVLPAHTTTKHLTGITRDPDGRITGATIVES